MSLVVFIKCDVCGKKLEIDAKLITNRFHRGLHIIEKGWLETYKVQAKTNKKKVRHYCYECSQIEDV